MREGAKRLTPKEEEVKEKMDGGRILFFSSFSSPSCHLRRARFLFCFTITYSLDLQVQVASVARSVGRGVCDRP